jgi:hypothetical protein
MITVVLSAHLEARHSPGLVYIPDCLRQNDFLSKTLPCRLEGATPVVLG